MHTDLTFFQIAMYVSRQKISEMQGYVANVHPMCRSSSTMTFQDPKIPNNIERHLRNSMIKRSNPRWPDVKNTQFSSDMMVMVVLKNGTRSGFKSQKLDYSRQLEIDKPHTA